jgi:hypothetical protein
VQPDAGRHKGYYNDKSSDPDRHEGTGR